jgi:chromosomal replication initiation ATPase DnaA
VPALERISAACADEWGVPLERLRSEQRTASVVTPRSAAMFIATRDARLSLGEVGKYFGRQGQTGRRARRVLEGRMAKDRALESRVQKVRHALQEGSQ